MSTNDISMPVSDIDWDTWQPEEVATLMFIIQGDSVLLIRKKRGLGAGKINGPGGRLEDGETPEACAIRETNEELVVNPLNVRAAGELFFHAEDMPRIHGYVFIATDYHLTKCGMTIDSGCLRFSPDRVFVDTSPLWKKQCSTTRSNLPWGSFY